MGRSLSPFLRQELANLDKKDVDSRHSAMKALKSYAQHLDSKSIPQFLAEVSEPNTPGQPSGEFTISLYEVLARVHGSKIVPQIANIMSTIMRTLSSSGGSFALHQACSKVVPAIARYGIDPSVTEEEKARIISALCKPLSDALMSTQESSASGAALCLKALVESSNWRFASGEMVNEVCLRVAGAMHEKSTQSNAHMGLAMALIKHNGLIAEAYARSLVRSGLKILDADAAEKGSNSQKRLSAIQMINFVMKFVDPRSISSELDNVVGVMEQCQSDRMPFVRGAAFEASQTAKSILAQKAPTSTPIMSSKFCGSQERSPQRSSWETNGSPVEFPSPESHVVDGSVMFGSFTDSPPSVANSSAQVYTNRRTNRRLWINSSDPVDVSLKDGFILTACSASKYLEDDFKQEAALEAKQEPANLEPFSGFASVSSNGAQMEDVTTCNQDSRRTITLDDVNISTTPRRLVRSLQDAGNDTSGVRESEHAGMQLESCAGEVGHQAADASISRHGSPCPVHCCSRSENSQNTAPMSKKSGKTIEELLGDAESVSSTGEITEVSALSASSPDVSAPKHTKRFGLCKFSFVFCLLAILASMALTLVRLEEDDETSGLVPT